MKNSVLMNNIELVGYIAAILTTSAFIPQALRIIKTNSAKDVSMGMYFVLTAGTILWLIYGFYLNSMPVILANSITLILVITILFLKIKLK